MQGDRSDREPCPSITPRIHAILVRQLGAAPDQIDADKRLAEDLDADSLDRAELVMAIEDEFGVIVPDDEETRVQTVGELVAMAERCGAK